jgi:CRISPR-associated protein Csd2
MKDHKTMNDRPLPLTNRHDFVYYFDVTNGNPNGDPDAGNMPRQDPETGRGLVTDACLKRKIRNFIDLSHEGESGFNIYVTDGAVLNEKHRAAYLSVRPNDPAVKKASKLNPQDDDEAIQLRQYMCDNFFDVRAFGAVCSTGINCGQVRGPVQLSFAESVEPISPMEVTITRMAATNEKEKSKKDESEEDDEKRVNNRTMGRKHIVPYGLYRMHGYVSAPYASHPTKGTGFSESDLKAIFEALDQNMFEHDRSAARGEMVKRKLIIFKHSSALGNAPSHELFARVTTLRQHRGSVHPIGSDATDNWPAARSFSDYEIRVDRSNLPAGVNLIER